MGRTLLTLDHDFLDDGRFPPALGPGVIVCSAPDEATLLRLLRYIDRRVIGVRVAAPGALPLAGRKIILHPDVLVDP
jgi:hypothetical protein